MSTRRMDVDVTDLTRRAQELTTRVALLTRQRDAARARVAELEAELEAELDEARCEGEESMRSRAVTACADEAVAGVARSGCCRARPRVSRRSPSRGSQPAMASSPRRRSAWARRW